MSDKNNEVPKAVVARITKSAVPTAQFSGESKEAFGKAAKLWILYLTTFANEITVQNGKSTISGDHVLAALEGIEFKDFIPALKAALEEHKEAPKTKKKSKKEQKEATKDSDKEETDKEDDKEKESEKSGSEEESK